MPRSGPHYFDYVSIARAAGISDQDLARLEAGVRADYPNDDLLYELRLLRTCNATKEGAATIADARREFPSDGRRVA